MDLQHVPQWPTLVHLRVQVLQVQVMPSVCTCDLGKCHVCSRIIIILNKTRSMEFQIVYMPTRLTASQPTDYQRVKKAIRPKIDQQQKAIIPCNKYLTFSLLLSDTTIRRRQSALLLWFGVFLASWPSTNVRFSPMFCPPLGSRHPELRQLSVRDWMGVGLGGCLAFTTVNYLCGLCSDVGIWC